MKVILVAGGAGFIGSNFIKYFLKRNKNFIIANIDKQAYPAELGRLTELEDSPRYHHVKGDVCNQDLTEYVMRKYKPSMIINFCCEPEQSGDMKKFRFSGDSSYSAAYSLLEGARYIWSRASLPDKRFLQISSDSVYGLTENDSEFFDEASALRPSDPLSAIRAGTDLLAGAYCSSFKLPVAILRSCNIYGPWQSTHCKIPTMIRNILADREPVQISSGPEREWMYVYDMCSAITRALFFAKPGEIYNVGSGETVSDYGIAAILGKLQGTSPEKLKLSAVDRHCDEACRLNSYKARFSLKWSNSYSLNEGLYETLKWYKSDDMQNFLT